MESNKEKGLLDNIKDMTNNSKLADIHADKESYDHSKKELDKIEKELQEISAKLKAEGKPSAHIDDALNCKIPIFSLKDDSETVLDRVRSLLPGKNNKKNSPK